jgi:hypothetical protein
VRQMSSILTYPTGVEYCEALQNTRFCFKDPALFGGNVTVDKLGMPKPRSGNYASVFTVEDANGRRWAVKCFTRYVDDQAIRYQRISETLWKVHRPWRVDFEYLPVGVLCRGTWFPVLKMEWVDATTLITFIENHLWEPAKLGDLALKFARLVDDLSALGIAHGDLQHDNLLVTSSGELKLIDYDGMFVPSLAQMGACEKGHINYQPPARTMNTWGSYLDNFSTWIIYSSLVALSIDPTLWTLLHDPGDDALLFNHSDFADRHNSRALLTFARSSSSDLQALGSKISRLWTLDLQAIPSLDPTALPAPGKQPGTSGPVPSITAMTSANVASGTIPDWVTRPQPGTQATASGVQGGVSWIAGHLAPLPLVAFHPSRLSLRLLVGLGLAADVAVGICAKIELLPTIMAGATAFAVVLGFVAITIILFRKTSEWRAKHEKIAIFKKRRAEWSKATREASKLEHARRDVDSREERAIEIITRESAKAQASEHNELADVDKKLAANLKDLEKQKQRVQSNELAETGRALRTYQQQHVTSYLSRASISSARIPGIGQGVVRSLATCGIHSAADFSGLQYRTGSRGGQQVYIIRRNGLPVHPNGVGEKKARELDNWRRGQERMAMATQPSSLPPAQAQAISSKYVQQRQTLADQEKVARTQATNDQIRVKQKWAPIHTDISAKIVPTRQSFAQERAQADLHSASAQKRVNAAIWQRELAERELAAYRNVSYRRYLAGIIRS